MSQSPLNSHKNADNKMETPNRAHEPESSKGNLVLGQEVTHVESQDGRGNKSISKSLLQQVADGDVSFDDLVAAKLKNPGPPPKDTPEYRELRRKIHDYMHSTRFFDSILNAPEFKSKIQPQILRIQRFSEEEKSSWLASRRHVREKDLSPERTRKMQRALNSYYRLRRERELIGGRCSSAVCFPWSHRKST